MDKALEVLRQAIVWAERDAKNADAQYDEAVALEERATRAVEHLRILAEKADEDLAKLQDAVKVLEGRQQ